MSGFWRPWIWIAAGGFLLSFVTLWRERVWRSRRGSCIATAYLAVGYLAFTVMLQDWAWPKPIIWDLPGQILGILERHFAACLAAFAGFMAGVMFCEHHTPRRSDVYRCPACDEKLLLWENNKWLTLTSVRKL